MIEVEPFNIADTVLMRVNEVYCTFMKTHAEIVEKYPPGSPKNYGHSFSPAIHKYAIEKGSPQRAVIVYTPKLGVVKSLKKPKDGKSIKKCFTFLSFNTSTHSTSK